MGLGLPDRRATDWKVSLGQKWRLLRETLEGGV